MSDPTEKRCFHDELKRARSEQSDAYIDVWYCPERGCKFEINRCAHKNRAEVRGTGPAYCLDCGEQVSPS